MIPITLPMALVRITMTETCFQILQNFQPPYTTKYWHAEIVYLCGNYKTFSCCPLSFEKENLVKSPMDY